MAAAAAAAMAAAIAAVAADLLFDDGALFSSFALVTAKLLLLFELIACVKLPLITFRGNGFGLIISTKERNINQIQKETKNFKSNACTLFFIQKINYYRLNDKTITNI